MIFIGGRLQLPGTAMSRYHTCRIKRGGAMVQTVSTSAADQSDVPGATTIRVLGILLILLGGYGLYVVASSVVVRPAQEGVVYFAVVYFAGLFLSVVFGLLTIVAGVLLVRLHRAGRLFALWVCSVILAFEVLLFGLILIMVAFALATSVPLRWPGLLFWLEQLLEIVLYLVAIILIARWRPPREIERLGRIFD